MNDSRASGGTLGGMHGNSANAKPLTPRQMAVLDRLIAVGASRPSAPPELIAELTDILETATTAAVARWTQRSFYLTKGMYLTAARCEGQVLADADRPRTGTSVPLIVGTVAHKAIQVAYTHPMRPVNDYVRQAVTAVRKGDPIIEEWWAEASASEQSDLLMQTTSRVTNFLDDFPPLQETWNPRFEEPMAAKVGRLTMSCRPDLVIGRPRGDLKQTLLVIDFKTSDVKEEHDKEARFYALVAALRHGVPPWRSTVYSLASGDYTEPDITPEVLVETAHDVGKAVTSMVDVLTDARPPALTPGPHCRYCPAKATCAASELGAAVHSVRPSIAAPA